MANYDGYLAGASSEIDNQWSDNIDAGTFQAWSAADVYDIGLTTHGTWRGGAPVNVLSSRRNGVTSLGHFDDLYHRIHVYPSEVDAGILVSSTDFEVEVWNAYLTSQELSSVSEDGTTGMTLDIPSATPTTFGPVESRVYVLTVDNVGPANIDATFTFNFPSDAPVLPVIGNRVLAWVFEPNWVSPVVEGAEWLTSIIESEDGTEDRYYDRELPRVSYSYLATVYQHTRRAMDTRIWAGQGQVYALPIWTGEQKLTSAVSAGSLTVPVGTDDPDIVVDSYLTLMLSVDVYEVVQIAAVGSGQVTISSGLGFTWPAGTRVFPTVIARMTEETQVTALSLDVWNHSVSFDVLTRWSHTEAEWSVDTYRGLPILLKQGNLRESNTREYQRKIQSLDNNISLPVYDDLSEKPKTFRNFLWTLLTKADVYAFKAWLQSRKGKFKGLWVPTYGPDLIPLSDESAVSDTLTITNISYARFLGPVMGRRDVLILFKNGSQMLRRIVSATEVSLSQETVQFDSAFGVDIAATDIKLICWVEYMRLAADKVELSWLNRGMAECNHKFVSAPDDV